MTSETEIGGAAYTAPPNIVAAHRWAVAAMAIAVLMVVAAIAVMWQVREVMRIEGVHGGWVDPALIATILAISGLLWPASRALRAAAAAAKAVRHQDPVEARVDVDKAQGSAFIALGYAALVACCLSAAVFIMANDMAVGRTFFYLPLITDKFGLISEAFTTNIMIFCIAEVLVLIWGLIVAIARSLPGKAGRPVRIIATLYCDIFRGLPAVITIYLVGFGLPLAGVPYLGDLPLLWYAVVALTLTYGAYVAEVYRSGIESIHWSQAAAARSLGLSYFQSLRFVIVPQAIRRIGPPLLNDFIGLQKDTALVNVIGVIDGFNQARIVASNHFNLSAVTVVAILFVAITIPQARLVDKMVERDQRRMRAGS